MATPTVGLVEVDVRYDRGTLAELAQQIPELSTQLSEVKVVNQESLDLLTERIRAGEQWVKSIDLIMEPVRLATHKAWKASLEARDELVSPVEKPLKAAKTICVNFIAAAREEAARKQREFDEEQRKKNEAEAKRIAFEMKTVGASKAEIKEAKTSVLATAAPMAAPKVEVSAGMSQRMLYSAQIVDLKAFLQHIVSDSYLLTLFGYSGAFKKAIESELRGEATKRKDAYRIPGTKLVKTPSGAWRS